MNKGAIFDENSLDALQKWINIFGVILRGPVATGAVVVKEIGDVLRKHGYEADTAALDAVIADATRREAMAAREATGDITGSISTGSTGE